MVPIFTAGELNMALGDFNFDQRNHSTCHNDKRGASLRYWSRHIFIELFHKWDLYFGNWILRLQCIETLKFYITKCQYTLSLQIWVFNEDFTTSSFSLHILLPSTYLPLQMLPTSTFISEVIYQKFILQRNAQ